MSKKLSFLLGFIPCLFACAGDAVLLERIRFEKDAGKRAVLLDKMQTLVDRTSHTEFCYFDEDPKLKTANPLLKFYDRTVDHIKKDISETQVVPGTAAIWYLYNMGFIIKTPTVCFGVDIHHRRAAELAEVLDFLAITHNHTDHYSMPLMREMNRLKKPVISNFFDNPYYTKAAEYTHRISGVTIHCGEADHNSRLKKFTMPLEFICPTGNTNFVLFTSGDCRSEIFLHKKSKQINLYAVHPFCGMKAINAAQKLAPQTTFLVHLQEMSHPVNKWRWTIAQGRGEQKIFNQKNLDSYLPVWGEKFIWDGKTLSGCRE